MRYTIEDIRQMPEGQTFDCKSIHIEPKALANTIVAMANADGGMIAVGISDKTRRIEGVDRMCRELSAIGTKEPQYHLVAFIMKASVWANELEEGQERTRKGQENIPGNQKQLEIGQKDSDTTQKNYPEKLPRKTTQKISAIQKKIVAFLRNNPKASRSEITSYISSITEDGVKYHLKVLQNKAVIKRIGPDKGGYWKVLSENQDE